MTIRYAGVSFWHDYNRSGTLTFNVKMAGLSRYYRSADPYKSHNAKRDCFFLRHHAMGLFHNETSNDYTYHVVLFSCCDVISFIDQPVFVHWRNLLRENAVTKIRKERKQY